MIMEIIDKNADKINNTEVLKHLFKKYIIPRYIDSKNCYTSIVRMENKMEAIVEEYYNFWRNDKYPLDLGMLLLLGGISELGLTKDPKERKLIAYGDESLSIVEREIFPHLIKPIYGLDRRIIRSVLSKLDRTLRKPGAEGEKDIIYRYYEAVYSMDNFLWITNMHPESVVCLFIRRRQELNPTVKVDRLKVIVWLLNQYVHGPIKRVPFSNNVYNKYMMFINYLQDEKKRLENDD